MIMGVSSQTLKKPLEHERQRSIVLCFGLGLFHFGYHKGITQCVWVEDLHKLKEVGVDIHLAHQLSLVDTTRMWVLVHKGLKGHFQLTMFENLKEFCVLTTPHDNCSEASWLWLGLVHGAHKLVNFYVISIWFRSEVALGFKQMDL